MNSKQKGAKGEREWAAYCREQGFDVRRTQQYCGGTEESADCIGLPYIHQEVKRVQALNIDGALEQCIDDLTDNGCRSLLPMPIVAHRKNSKRWKVTMYADDWFRLYKEWYSGKVLAEKKD
jgi:Holliday junction resolvase